VRRPRVEHLGLDRGHRTLTITRKGGKVVTIPLAPRTARALDLAIVERTAGRCSWPRTGSGWTGTPPASSPPTWQPPLGKPGPLDILPGGGSRQDGQARGSAPGDDHLPLPTRESEPAFGSAIPASW
jgi:hypothetical protein